MLGVSDQHSSLVAMVRNLGTTCVSPQSNVMFDENCSTIQNDTRRKDPAVDPISNDLFESCRDHYGDEGSPPEGDKSAPEGAVSAYPSISIGLGGE